MMKNTYKRGFTLIELLVVIAIIGILASVVLASLNTARDKGADAAVKSNVNGMRAQAELFYDGTGGNTYTNVCADTNMVNALTAAKNAVSTTLTAGGNGDGECVSSATAWAAWVNLKATQPGAYCVDSTGQSKITAADRNSTTDALTACP